MIDVFLFLSLDPDPEKKKIPDCTLHNANELTGLIVQEAEDTRSFWKTAGSKLEELKAPNRRLVMDNRSHPLYLLGAHMSRYRVTSYTSPCVFGIL